jgi:parallel beta-helix repeat protein
MKARCIDQGGSRKAVLKGIVLGAALLLTADVFAGSSGRVYHQLRPEVSETEIQQALDALPEAGGIVVLPPGTITITRPLLLKRSHQTLRGAGTATVLRLADGANCPVIIMGEPVNQPSYTVSGVCVDSLFIDGNRSGQQRELWKEQGEGSEIRNNGITIQRVSDSKVENVVAARCRSGGLVTTLGVQRLVVRGLEAFDNEFDGLACYATTESRFMDLNLHSNPGAGISLDLNFADNTISNAQLRGNDLGIFMRDSRRNQFLNVTIHKSHNHGVFMAQAEIPQLTACINNSFTNLQATNCGGAAFRINDVTCTDNTIIRARFEENQHGGLSLAHPELIELR